MIVVCVYYVAVRTFVLALKIKDLLLLLGENTNYKKFIWQVFIM